jgi:CRP-like cAMP-binding protein
MTHRTDKKQSLSNPKFFDALQDDSITAIMRHAESQSISPKGVIIHGGERATHLYLLKSGSAKYYRLTKAGDELTFRLLSPGDVFGLGTLLEEPLAYIGSAEAISECQILIWKHKTVRMLASRFPQLGQNALQIVIGYLARYAERHLGLVTKTAEQRLATVVLSLAQRSARVRSNGVEINATNEQLGALADTTHFNVSRILSGWHRKGTVRKERGTVILQAPEALPID